MVIYYLIIGFVLLLVIGIWIMLRVRKKIKKRRELVENIPQEIINEFESFEKEFERRKKEDENTNPYQIIWEYARKRIGRGDQSIKGEEQRAGIRELHGQFAGRKDIQGLHTTRDEELDKSNSRPERSSSRNFFSRFRRR